MEERNVDYIIVGLGLAGIAFAEQLYKKDKSFVVFEDNSQTSSLVAGGVYNPVILKRFTPVWNAKSQLEKAMPFYTSLEEKLGIRIDSKFQTKKAFKSIEDQNNWYIASDKPLLSSYMNPKVHNEKIDGVLCDHGFGEVYETGRIHTKELLSAYRAYLKEKNQIIFEAFKHHNLKINDTSITYNGINATYIVFAEGYGVVHNPYFKQLPLNEVKGELITIHAPDLNIDFLLKSTLFVLPLGDNYYKVGATFNWKDKTSTPSEEGRNELVEKLKNVINVPYTITEQTAGIRPTVKDRRPLVGTHPNYKNVAVLNGLGTRGVMIAPSIAQELFEHLEHETALSPEIDIKRFGKKN